MVISTPRKPGNGLRRWKKLSNITAKTGRPFCCINLWNADIMKGCNCLFLPIHRLSILFPKKNSRPTPETGMWNAASKALSAGTRWPWSRGQTSNLPASAVTFPLFLHQQPFMKLGLTIFSKAKVIILKGIWFICKGMVPRGFMPAPLLKAAWMYHIWKRSGGSLKPAAVSLRTHIPG